MQLEIKWKENIETFENFSLDPYYVLLELFPASFSPLSSSLPTILIDCQSHLCKTKSKHAPSGSKPTKGLLIPSISTS